MSRKRVLITGARGFIGRWSVAPLLARGFEVHAVISRPIEKGRGMPAELLGANVHAANLFSPGVANALVAAVRPSHLLHFAWIATPGIYWTSSDNISWVAASLDLLRAFYLAGGTRAVMAGSCAEYDWTRADICREDATPLATDGPTVASPYACCKVSLQKMLSAFGRQEAMSAAWGRIFHQFGPYEHQNRLVASVIRQLLRGRVAECTHGRQVRNFLHVADVGSAFAALLDSAVEGPVNIGSEDRLTLAEMINLIAKRIGRPDLIRLGARSIPLDEPRVLVPDVNRLYREVGWRPSFSMEGGLADAIAWWQRVSL